MERQKSSCYNYFLFIINFEQDLHVHTGFSTATPTVWIAMSQ